MATTYTLISDPQNKFEVVGSQLRLRNTLLAGTSASALVRRTIDGTNDVVNITVRGVPKVREIRTVRGGRPANLPQAFFDKMAAEAVDPNVHPSLGTADVTATKNGLWSDPTVWSTGVVPTEGQKVNTSTFDITYDVESDVKIASIHVSGQGILRWAINKDTRLWVGTIMCHGTFIIGDCDNPIPESTTAGKPRAEIVFWANEAPLTTVKLGLMTMGPVRMQGAKKTHWLRSNASIPVGATSATLSDLASSGWRVGDTILLAGTEKSGTGTTSTDSQYTGPTQFYGPSGNSAGVRTRGEGYRISTDEERVITSIVGSVVSWTTPLTFAHNLYTGTLPRGQVVEIKPIVANKSRSIQLRTAGGKAGDTTIWPDANLATLQKRAHAMFMFSDDIQVRGVRALDMGRTDTNPSLAAPIGKIDLADPENGPFIAYDKAPGDATRVQITDTNNVRGRYPLHVHGTGAYFARRMTVLEDCVADTSPSAPPIPGWAIVHHNSKSAFERCIVHNVRGAGMVSELGNETGQWIDNLVCYARGDGYGSGFGGRAEWWQNHNGHYGTAFENQARQVLLQGNHATSSHKAFSYMQQDVADAIREPDVYSLRFMDPIAKGNGTWNAVNAEQTQIPDFIDNTFANVGQGLYVEHRLNKLDRLDETPMVMRGFHGVNSGVPFSVVNYSHHYYCFDSLWMRVDRGMDIGAVAWAMSFGNILIKDSTNGFTTGYNYGGFLTDCLCENVTSNQYSDAIFAISTANEDPTQHPHYNMMDQWVVTNNDVPNPGYTVRARQGKSLNSATDLPQLYPAPPLGRYMPNGSPPVPFGSTPYFLLDTATSELNVANGIRINGTLRDCVGDRRFGDYQNPETPFSNYGVQNGRTLIGTTSVQLVLRNGCFLDGTAWKSRLWFIYADRATGEYYFPTVDVILTEANFPVGFLQANVVDPESTKPSMPVVPELAPVSTITPDTTPPVVTSLSSIFATDGQPLNYVLQSNKGQGKWTLSGTDAALFEISGTFNLRWAGNVVRTIAAPADANADNTYDLSVTFTDQFGNASVPKPMQVQLTYFTDNFDGLAGSSMIGRTGWTLVQGPDSMKLDGNGSLIRPPNGAAQFMRSYDLTSYDQAVDFDAGGGSSGASLILLRFQDPSNYIRIARTASNPNGIGIYQMKGGVNTELGRYAQASSGTFQVVGNNIQWKDTLGVPRATVSGGPAAAGLTTLTMTDPPPLSYGVGIVGQASASGPWLSRIVFRPLQAPASFADNFEGVDGPLEDRTGWTRVNGVAGALAVRSNQLAIVNSADTVYTTPDMGTANQRITYTPKVGSGAWIIARYVDPNNFIGIRIDSATSEIQVFSRIAGAYTLMASYSSSAINNVCEFDLLNSAMTVKVAGVSRVLASGSNVLPSNVMGTRGGLNARTATSNPWIDNFKIEAI